MPLIYSDKDVVSIGEKLQTPKNRQCVVIFQMAMFDEDGRHIASAEKVRMCHWVSSTTSGQSFKVQAKPIKTRHILNHPISVRVGLCFGTMSGIPIIQVHRA